MGIPETPLKSKIFEPPPIEKFLNTPSDRAKRGGWGRGPASPDRGYFPKFFSGGILAIPLACMYVWLTMKAVFRLNNEVL